VFSGADDDGLERGVSDDLGHLGERVWDAVVVGAGPGGSLAARELARRGRSVLLVEKSVFPRWKVCGACLGGAGVRTLERAGLGGLLTSIGARPVARTRLVWRGRSIAVPMRGMVAVSRGALDTALARCAEEEGAVFVSGVRAAWEETGSVSVGGVAVSARSVVVAGGLRAAEPDGTRGAWVDPGSWIGIGAAGLGGAVEGAGAFGADELTMIVGERGYVGRIVTEDGIANWAAAVDPAFLRSCGSPADAVRAICDEAGVDARTPAAGWVGTPSLTRRTPAQWGTVYRVGDAAGYVEPITGEGMSWALLGAEALAPVLDRALAAGHTDAWTRLHARMFRSRRVRCRAVARGLRSPAVMRAAFAVLGVRPGAGSAVVGRMIGAGVGGGSA
jgi:flavin-dependent dehydrogenase